MTKPKADPAQRGRKSPAKMPLLEQVLRRYKLEDARRAAGAKQLRDFVKYFNDDGIVPNPAKTDEEMMALDHDALDRALETALKDPERRDRITRKLTTEHRRSVARFASYGLQIEALGLLPHQTPPSYLECDYEKFDDILAQPDDADYACVRLFLALWRHGVSAFEPDPIGALKEKLKHARRGKPPP
jgi:hypothetical protein